MATPSPSVPSPAVSVVAAVASCAVVVVAAWIGTTRPELFADPNVVLAAGRLSPVIIALVLGAAGLLGAVAAGWRLLVGRRDRTSRPVLGVGVLLVATFGLAFQSAGSISLAGYLLALALPVALLVLVIQACRHYRRLRLPLIAVAAGLITLGVWSGSLTGSSLARLGTEIAGGFATAAPRLAVTLVVTAAAVAWFAVVLAELRGSAGWSRLGAAVARHRTVFTVIAALGPLPYAIARLTWLTPWPQFSPPAADLPPEIRLWGLLLGGAALLGSVLTIGLIRPWGEHFPRWMPGLAGRPVPVAAAAGPGGVVAAVVCVSAIPMLLQLTLTDGGEGLGIDQLGERLLTMLVLPLWLWGPMLALAVWGYVTHRRQTETEPVRSLADRTA